MSTAAMNHRRITPFKDDRARFEAGRLGMWLFLASLGMLFAASLIGYLVIRVTTDWPRDLPMVPPILWISTLLLGASSLTMQSAVNAARRNAAKRLQLTMAVTTLLAALFLVMQSFAWWAWFNEIGERLAVADRYRWALTGFFVMTGIHALHVLGGIWPMLVVTARAFAGRYSAERHHGVHYCAMYWHFLGAVWVVLFITLLFGT